MIAPAKEEELLQVQCVSSARGNNLHLVTSDALESGVPDPITLMAAAAWSEEETFVCSVCLESLNDPATLPCGHSYCLACIQRHWDKGDSKGQYRCPQCRQRFDPRPALAKSTVLVEAMKKLRTNTLTQSGSSMFSSAPPSEPVYLELLDGDIGYKTYMGSQEGSVYPQLPTSTPRPCPKHNRPLDLFCHEDREYVCEVCCYHGHKGHSVLKPADERKQRQKELNQVQAEVERKVHEAENTLKDFPNVTHQHKALAQALQKERLSLFSEVANIVDLTSTQVSELLDTQERCFGSQIEGLIHGLEQEAVQLRLKGEELRRLANMQDHTCFLKNFFTMEQAGGACAIPDVSVLSKEEEVAESVRSTLKDLHVSVKEMCKSTLATLSLLVNEHSATAPSVTPDDDDHGQATVQNTVYEMLNPVPPPRPQSHVSTKPSCQLPVPLLPPQPFCQLQEFSVTAEGLVSPDPKMREELLKFRFKPTMDPDTVFRHILLSDGGHKATLRAENLNLADNPERFHYWRQLLCKEPLAGSPYYWEVEWTGQKITIGVAYREMDRKCTDEKSRLGHNPYSWTLYWSGTGFSFWHNGHEKLLGSPKSRRIGTYLDQQAGILAFYRITNNQADLIHRHMTQFTGPLYPGFRFWGGAGATITICQLE
ncbi:E3 ubiquitin/ISG15 ligase TRIM25-like isoform X1 [Nerophis ophidion]|uniref:E3 ubiquitin/ISG15 ligase TRIM25-like isoform X1 n=2 Tax=Nerophis ophidion TaxID=159077 RepID=UPI002ADF70E2|nr:E3 ubiquitin/ISG15 ligase TRIM25-like isoform X1 [Nerophis ophidion]